jgi:cytochrome oxidase Cu insertion factor (SCO1/SenC/PrrC family)
MKTNLLSSTTMPLLATWLLLAGCERQTGHRASCCATNEPAGPGDAGVESSAIHAAGPELLATGWAEPAGRTALNLTHQLTRHDGAKVTLKELAGQPLAISFAYTRCTNPNKCRLVSTTMSALRKRVQQAGLLDKVKLVLISYDADYDSPKIMREYSERVGLELDDHTLFLRPPVDPRHRLFQDLKVNASFNPDGVTMHGIQLLLVDKSGRLARSYRALIWDNDQVTKELARLAAE